MNITLTRYFAARFIVATLAVFGGMFLLVVLVDYIELSRRVGSRETISAFSIALTSFYRVPYVFEILMPFCVLVGAMTSFLTLSRRMELVVARAAGISAWQFTFPALACALVLGIMATTIYNPVSTYMQARSIVMEAGLFGLNPDAQQAAKGVWLNQVTPEGQSIINARSTEAAGQRLKGISIFRMNQDGSFKDRIEAEQGELGSGFWRLSKVRQYAPGNAMEQHDVLHFQTSLNKEQIKQSSSSPDTVSFWRLSEYIAASKQAGLPNAEYKLQYHKLIARPMLLVSMVLLAAAVSLRFFRFGGVQKMVLGGVGAGFLLYVLSKVTEDLSKAELMYPIAAAWFPVLVGSLTGVMALLYQEDG